MIFTQALSNFLVTKGSVDGVNSLHASGLAAQQSVARFHLHLIPRRLSDGLNAWPTLPGASKGPSLSLILSFPIPRNAKRHGDDNNLRAGPKPVEKGISSDG